MKEYKAHITMFDNIKLMPVIFDAEGTRTNIVKVIDKTIKDNEDRFDNIQIIIRERR